MIMRRRYINFLLTYFHNSSKKVHITKYSIKSTINSTEAKIKLSFQSADCRFSTWLLALSFLMRDARASRDGQLAILWQHCFICRHTYNIMCKHALIMLTPAPKSYVQAPQYLAHNVPLSFMSFLNFASAASSVMLFQVICFTWCCRKSGASCKSPSPVNQQHSTHYSTMGIPWH